MRNDPTDTGGLFTGRRPGSQPVKYKNPPPENNPKREKLDRWLARLLAGTMVIITCLTVAVVPPGALWIVAHVPYLAERLFLALIIALAIIMSLGLLSLALLTRMDRWWILLKRASGVKQKTGILPAVLAGAMLIVIIAGGGYLILGGGLADAPMGPQLP